MGKNIGNGSLARGKILGQLAFYTWVPVTDNDQTEDPNNASVRVR